MKMKNILNTALLISIFLCGSLFAENDSLSVKKIIKFDHQLHLEMAECTDCHSAVPETMKLDVNLLPKMDNCSSCHDVEDDENCSQCHYEDVYEPFVYQNSEIIFNHQKHLKQEKVNCNTCHVKTEGENVNIISPSMNTCITCHSQESSLPNECETCHTASLENLKPETHSNVEFLKYHGKYSETDNCQSCHKEEFCESCHIASGLDGKDLEIGLQTIYSPHQLKDKMTMQKINRVHDLTFRFTHGIEAKGKTFECQTCHTTEAFCDECHQNEGGDFKNGVIKPISHYNSNFKTFGVGSGGGLHAELARRDMESCATCHDTQGSDPVCILCHVDNDGIKGTNPKTHEKDFLKEVGGSWHDDDGAVCYTCHTTSNASTGKAGVGFCGYCHDKK